MYYFLASDGRKYSGSSEAYAASDIFSLSTDYRFAFQLDPESTKIASVTKGGRLTAYKEGNIIVYLYLCEPGKAVVTDKAELVGQFNVTVTDEPELSIIEYEEYITVVSSDDDLSNVQVNFSLYDQYGTEYSASYAEKNGIKVEALKSNYSGTVSGKTWDSSLKNGKFNFNLSGKPKGTYSYVISYKDIIEDTVEIVVQ